MQRRRPSSNPETLERGVSVGYVLAICFILIGLIWFVFGQTIRFPFVNFDDPEYVYEVPEINHGLTWHGIAWAFTHFPSPNWYPLTNISHMLEFQLFGMNAGAYHFTNVLLHTIAVLVLFLALCRMTNTLWRSAFVAAVFAIHPLRVESVAWVIERKDVLSGVFFMLTLAAYIWYTRRRSIARYAIMSILLACGLMSKPMLVTTPVILLLLDYWPLGRFGNQRSEVRDQKSEVSSQRSVVSGLVIEKIPLFALSLILAFIASSGIAHARTAAGTLPFGWRIANAFVSYAVYVWQMIWPANLAVWYPHPENHLPIWEILCAAIFVIGTTVLTFLLRKSRPYVFVGWFWYLVMLAPVIGVIQVNLQSHADRYTYLPQIGLYLIVAWAITDILKTPNAQRPTPNVESRGTNSVFGVRRSAFGVCLAATIVIAALAWTARAQTTHWRDSESLWTSAIAATKDNAFAQASLADLLLRRGRLDEAILHCQEAIRIQPDNADAHNNLGLALLQKGDERAAADQFKKCLEIDPDHMNAMVNLAWILATSADSSTRDGSKAVELAEKVHQRAGHANVIVMRTLAAAYAESGRFAEAIDVAEQAIRLANAQGNIGLANDLQRNIDNYRMNRPLRSR